MKRTSVWRMALTVLMAVVLSSALLADGGTLRYRHGLPPVLEQEVAYPGRQELTPAEEKPELKAEPELAGEPTYFLIDLGEKGAVELYLFLLESYPHTQFGHNAQRILRRLRDDDRVTLTSSQREAIDKALESRPVSLPSVP